MWITQNRPMGKNLPAVCYMETAEDKPYYMTWTGAPIEYLLLCYSFSYFVAFSYFLPLFTMS